MDNRLDSQTSKPKSLRIWISLSQEQSKLRLGIGASVKGYFIVLFWPKHLPTVYTVLVHLKLKSCPLLTFNTSFVVNSICQESNFYGVSHPFWSSLVMCLLLLFICHWCINRPLTKVKVDTAITVTVCPPLSAAVHHFLFQNVDSTTRSVPFRRLLCPRASRRAVKSNSPACQITGLDSGGELTNQLHSLC